MNSLECFQFTLSFALQASLVTYVACAVERRCHDASVKAKIWTYYYCGLLSLLAAGLLLPRIRWASPWRQLDAGALLSVTRIESALGKLLAAGWIAGSCLMLVRWIHGFLKLQSFLRSCRPVDGSERASLEALASDPALRPQGRTVEFRFCSDELGPFCYQLHRPVIFLPRSLLGGPQSELQYVLQHELAHLRTQHPLQVFAQRVVQTAMWYLPLIWRAGHRASLAREYVCDDAATARGASTADYLRTLLRFAERRSSFDGAALGAARSASELRLRAQRLAARRPAKAGRLGSLAPAVVAMAAVLASQVGAPTNPLASPKTHYSPWPVWSAAALHAFDVSVRDFDQFDARLQVYELVDDREDSQSRE